MSSAGQLPGGRSSGGDFRRLREGEESEKSDLLAKLIGLCKEGDPMCKALKDIEKKFMNKTEKDDVKENDMLKDKPHNGHVPVTTTVDEDSVEEDGIEEDDILDNRPHNAHVPAAMIDDDEEDDEDAADDEKLDESVIQHWNFLGQE